MIILLNGTSSAGKTTIARILQEKFDGVLLLYGVDGMVQTAFPAKCDFPPYNEKAAKVSVTEIAGQPHARLTLSPYMYPVYQAAVHFYKRLSAQGYSLIVDEVLFDEKRISPFFEILADETVYFIGIKPDKDVVLRREKERGDRLEGLAVGLYDEVYNPRFSYDLLLDTGKLAPAESVERILRLLETEKKPQGFIRSAKNWR